MHQSVATIDHPEFINLKPIDLNPLMSKCEIKVLYVGENRNRSYITKQVALEMAKTLRGAPIVGYFMENKEDFGDHGEQVIIDGEGVKFKTLTKPYGFVAPDSKIWFQKFIDTDDAGREVQREYLMTEGYLWTGQFAECQRVINEGNPQSMELDGDTLQGNWSKIDNSGVEFFIINDAIFSKLCILGEDVEPCFEGASVTAPAVSTSFSKDDNFVKDLYSMMNDLKFMLQNREGGTEMQLENTEATEVEVTEAVVETEVVEEAPVVEETPAENFSANLDNSNENESAENQDTVEGNFSKKEDEEKEEKSEAPAADEKSDSESEEKPADDKKDDEEEDKKKKFELLETELSELKTAYAALQEENASLVEYKNSVEKEKKQSLIDSFYMLDEADKEDVKTNIDTYSLEDIESKLSVICVRKKVNFSLDEENSEETNQTLNVFALEQEDASIPAWVKAVQGNM